MSEQLDKNYWDSRYQTEQTGWDLGTASGPIRHYIDQISDKDLRILIPGCGNAYEAEYLSEQGFSNITLIDISPSLVQQLRNKFEGRQEINVIEGDFFEHQGEYDLILEQTFMCALDPKMREAYVKKMHSLLSENGKLAGLLFGVHFEKAGPPFGGSISEYELLFSNYFKIQTMEKAYNSVKPREGNELFIIFNKNNI
jgi:SAM-dependent methyltransferase